MEEDAEVNAVPKNDRIDNKVQCPVCALEMPAAHINSHLDTCLEVKPMGSTPGKKRRLSSFEETGASEGRQQGSAGPSFPLFRKHKTIDGTSEDTLKSPFFPMASPSNKKQGLDVASGSEGYQKPGDVFKQSQYVLKEDMKKENNLTEKLEGKPLADKMRPCNLQDYVGQNKVLGENTMLRTLLQANDVPSIILWGPPGCGKVLKKHEERYKSYLSNLYCFIDIHERSFPHTDVTALAVRFGIRSADCLWLCSRAKIARHKKNYFTEILYKVCLVCKHTL